MPGVEIVPISRLDNHIVFDNLIPNHNYNIKFYYTTIDSETKEEVIEMTEDTDIHFNGYSSNVEYVIDNNINDVKIDVKYLKGTKYNLRRNGNDYYFEYDFDFMKMYKIALNDFKDKKIKNYDDGRIINYTVTLSEDNYNKLEQKHEVISEDNLDEYIENYVENHLDQE